jgi:syntaxin of plants SYP7
MSKKPVKRMNLKGLCERLDEIHDQLTDAQDKKKQDEGPEDEFTRLKKLSSKQIGEIRRTITERDDLIASSSGSGGHQSVQLSARIRELLREVQDTHGLMQKCVQREEKKLAKGKRDLPYTQEDLETHRETVILVGKHIAECQNLERKRYAGRTGGKGGVGAATGSDVKRSAETTDLADIDPDVEKGLTQLKRNDEMLDVQLEEISKGMRRLKGIAVDQSNEVKLQDVMIAQIADNMDKATDHLNDVNVKLKDTLQKAGGATNIIVKLILLILLCAIGAYVYNMMA